MMNDKEYVNNTCNKCLNKYNENDLCNIVGKINGTYGCYCCNRYISKRIEIVSKIK